MRRKPLMKRTTFGWVAPENVPFYSALIFCLGGLVFLGVGYLASNLITKEAREIVALETPVKVIKVDARKVKRRMNERLGKRHRGDKYRPVFQATLPSGEVITHASNSWQRPAAYKVGDTAAGYYHPTSHAIFTDRTLKGRAMIPLAFKFLGGILAISGAIALVIIRRRKIIP